MTESQRFLLVPWLWPHVSPVPMGSHGQGSSHVLGTGVARSRAVAPVWALVLLSHRKCRMSQLSDQLELPPLTHTNWVSWSFLPMGNSSADWQCCCKCFCVRPWLTVPLLTTAQWAVCWLNALLSPILIFRRLWFGGEMIPEYTFHKPELLSLWCCEYTKSR